MNDKTKEKRTVQITIASGAVQKVDAPSGVRVIVRDYDVEESDQENFDIRKGQDGLYEHLEFGEEAESPALYLELFHGRTHPEEELDDWGEQGPIFKCPNYCHTTYGCDIKMGEMDGGFCDLTIDQNGLVYYDGLWYGDWSVFIPEEDFLQSGQFQSRLQDFDPEKAQAPETEGPKKALIDLGPVDWELLRAQKQSLLSALPEVATGKIISRSALESAFGLINLLDHLQDQAAEILGEEAVFGKPIMALQQAEGE